MSNRRGCTLKKFLLAVVAIPLVWLTGCAPQTRAAYIGDTYTKKETFTVPRKLDAVVASLNKQAKTCVNKEGDQMQMLGGHMGVVHIERNLTVTKPSTSRAELTYRVIDSSLGGVPPDGQFMFAADMKVQGSGSTQVTFYNRYTSDTVTNAIREWIKGNDSACLGFGGK